MKTNTITAAEVTKVIREFAGRFESKKMTKEQVASLRDWMAKSATLEEARIVAFCEVENLKEPEAGEFETLEAFKAQLKEEGVL